MTSLQQHAKSLTCKKDLNSARGLAFDQSVMASEKTKGLQVGQ